MKYNREQSYVHMIKGVPAINIYQWNADRKKDKDPVGQ